MSVSAQPTRPQPFPTIPGNLTALQGRHVAELISFGPSANHSTFEFLQVGPEAAARTGNTNTFTRLTATSLADAVLGARILAQEAVGKNDPAKYERLPVTGVYQDAGGVWYSSFLGNEKGIYLDIEPNEYHPEPFPYRVMGLVPELKAVVALDRWFDLTSPPTPKDGNTVPIATSPQAIQPSGTA